MINKSKLKKIATGISRTDTVDTARSVEMAKGKIQELKDRIESSFKVITDLKAQLKKREEELSSVLDQKLSTLKTIMAEQKTASLKELGSLSAQIDGLKADIQDISNRKVPDFQGQIKEIEDELKGAMFDLSEDNEKRAEEVLEDSQKGIKSLEEELKKLRVETMSLMASKGGGNMNRNILVGNNPSTLSRYTDLNLIAGSNITLSYANNNIRKTTDLTIAGSGGGVSGSGTANEITYWVSSTVLGSLTVATYPSLTELSYVKGVTSALQTQLNGKANTALSNLASVAINTSLLPASNNSIDLGSTSKYWNDVFLGGVLQFKDVSNSNPATLSWTDANGIAGFPQNLLTLNSTSGTANFVAGAISTQLADVINVFASLGISSFAAAGPGALLIAEGQSDSIGIGGALILGLNTGSGPLTDIQAGAIYMSGFDGTGLIFAPMIQFLTTEDWGSNNFGTKLRLNGVFIGAEAETPVMDLVVGDAFTTGAYVLINPDGNSNAVNILRVYGDNASDILLNVKGQSKEVTLSNSMIVANGLVTQYNAINTVSNGVGSEVALVDLTAQSAAIGATTIYAVPANGYYRVSWVATITQAATTSSSLGGATGLQVRFTSPTDSVVKTENPTTPTVSAANTTATSSSGVETAYCKAGTNLQYLFGYTSVGLTAMNYELHIRVEAL